MVEEVMGRGKGGSTSHGKSTPSGIRTTSAMRSDSGVVELVKESQDSRLEGWKQRMSPEVIKGLARAYGDGEYKLGKKASDVDELSAASNLVDSTIDKLISVLYAESQFDDSMWKQHGTKTGNRVVPPSLADIKSALKGQDVAKLKFFNEDAYKEVKDATIYGQNNKYDMASRVPSFGAGHLKTGFEKVLKRMKPEMSEAFVKDNILYQKIQEPLTRFVNTLGDFSSAGQEKLAALRVDLESRVVDTPYVKEMRAMLDGAVKSAEKKEKARERRTQKNLEKLKKEARAVDVGNKW